MNSLTLRAKHSLLWRSQYIFDILICVCIDFYYLSALVGCLCLVSIRMIIYGDLNVCRCDSTSFAENGKVGPVRQVNNTNFAAIVTANKRLSRSAIAV